MHDSTPQPPASPETIARGHEPSDVRLRGFLIFLAALVGTGVVVHVAIWLLMVGTQRLTERRDPEISPLARQPRAVAPPQPWLQPSPPQGATPQTDWQDMDALRARERQVLTTYAMDPQTGETRIPIDRAIDLLIERGNAATPTTRRAGGER
jgi:hypothetical protein